MVNLFELMQQAQNGAAVDAMAKQFDLTPKQAENAVDVLLPAFALALQRQMANPQLWPVLLGTLQPVAPSPFDASRAATADGMRQGAEWMERLFGSSDLSRQVATQAAAVSGLPATILQQMMPAMATMLMSGMLKTFSQEGLAGIIDAMGRAMQAGTHQAAPVPAPAPSPPPAAEATNPFSAYMDAWAAMLGAAGGVANEEAAPREPEPEPEPEPPPEPTEDAAPNPFDPVALAAMMAQFMGAATPPGGAAAHSPEKAEEPAAPESPPAGPQPGSGPAGPETPEPAATGSDAFAALIETGREAQELYLRNLQELFASAGRTNPPEGSSRS